jgi:hypothetical protein
MHTHMDQHIREFTSWNNMLRRLGSGILWSAVFYVLGAVAGELLVVAISPNTHDLAVEAAMTSLFVIGPIAGFLGLILGVSRSRKQMEMRKPE